MATVDISAKPSGGSRGARIVSYSLITLLLALLAIGGWLYWLAKGALPQLDGKVRAAGLTGQVTVIRDTHGVPTIEAASLDDLFFAQGYVTAQDRLWQMDIMRRFAAGTMAEVLGPELVEHDREQRILGMRVAARKAVDVASPQVRSHYADYARGVNAYIETSRGHLPVEFRILGYAPQPWTPEDSTLIAAQMVKDLSTSPRRALVREKILARLGPELTGDLYVNASEHDRPPTVIPKNRRPRDIDDDDEDDDDSGPDSAVVENFKPTAMEMGVPGVGGAREIEPAVNGSNNWVISGAHTVSGKPLLSNDMHLGHQMPNLWYEAHLHCGDFDVAGVTLPGLPYVIVGHNQRIAWGFTNIGPTVEDVYVETFNGSGQYLTPEGWKAAEHRKEVIEVKGKAEVTMDVVLTRHGPIVSALVPGESRQLALRWTLYDGIHNPFLEVNKAQTWEQFGKAFAGFDAPAQNVVYADVDSNIGYQATGKIPIRASGDGSLPENGSDDAHEWTGYIPFEKLPHLFNPSSGILATANSRITPKGYPYSISTEWEAPWRSERIYRVLETGRKFSAADMLALQNDIYSEVDRYFAERFVDAVDHSRRASTRDKRAAEVLRQWDGRMLADSAAPTLETRARAELTRLLLEPKLGAEPEAEKKSESNLNWTSYQWGMQSVWLENVVVNQPKRWLPTGYANYNDLLAAAIEAAVDAPGAPRELNSWSWGHYNPVEIRHPVLGKVPFLRGWTGPGVRPQSGSGFTVKAVTRRHGPSERMTVDLSNLDNSTLNLVTGEAGNVMSPYYMDQWKAWYDGSTFSLPFSQAAVEKRQAHVLVMEP
jgi:penicillin amidase